MSRQLDNFTRAAAVLPGSDGFLPSGATDLENSDRHGEREIAHRNIHSAVFNDVVRHFVDERRQLAFHNFVPPKMLPERFGSGADSSLLIKALTKLVDSPFRQTAVAA